MKTLEATHTPGPWRASFATVRQDNSPVIVCDCHEGGEANARLIAAAPEMLCALEMAADFISLARHYFPKSMHDSGRFQLEQTCAAIGKAIHAAKG